MSEVKFINLDEIRNRFDCEAKPIPWALDYAVSNSGRVFSARMCVCKKRGFIREMKQSNHIRGYKYVSIATEPHKSRKTNVHRLVAEVFLGPCPEGKSMVLHIDGNPANNLVENLRWGTHAENMIDMVAHARSHKGTRSPMAKLNDNIVRAIRILDREGYTNTALAKLIGVDTETIRRAASGEQWSHVSPDTPDGGVK